MPLLLAIRLFSAHPWVIPPEMALRLSKALGRSPESWLAMQDNYDLWQARQTLDLAQVGKLEFKYA